MPFKFTRLEIPAVVLIDSQRFPDERGFFTERYKESDFRDNGISTVFRQDNHSMSKKGVLRGIHYQMDPAAQGKLVSVTSGSIFDVAVDIRWGSPTFGKWVGEVISAENNRMLWIPEGFAHAFLSLEDSTSVLYKTTAEYSPQHDRGILWNDPDIGVRWPGGIAPILSDKDKKHPSLKDAEINFAYEK